MGKSNLKKRKKGELIVKVVNTEVTRAGADKKIKNRVKDVKELIRRNCFSTIN